MTRKLLFLVFTDDRCRINHAFMHALELEAHGHRVRIVLDGEATRCLAEREGRFGELFAQALAQGIVAGACRTAAGGCASGDPVRDVAALATRLGVPLLGSMRGHASLTPFVDQGFEIVVF